ncbi:uncharacterized protein LOC135110174 isoform X2 [Scylla paramamosain]|uniref:uncharacterized protein LOC135110174 isoform X2 n=1 Tax=Scylla paramamosain TaxID=85552 RepID=UPI003082B1BB
MPACAKSHHHGRLIRYTKFLFGIESSYLTVCEVVSIEPIPEEVEEVEVEVPTAGRPSTSQPSVPQRPSKRHRLHDDMYVDKRSNFLKEKQKVEKGMMKRKEHLRSSKNNRWLPQYITDNSQ